MFIATFLCEAILDMKKKIKERIKNMMDKQWFRLTLLGISATLSALVLTFSSLTMTEAVKPNFDQVSIYFLCIYIFIGVMGILIYLQDRNKINLIRSLTILLSNVVIGVVNIFGKDVPYLYNLCFAMYCFIIILDRVSRIVIKHDVRSIIFNVIVIGFVIFLVVGMLYTPMTTEQEIQEAILSECVALVLISFFKVASIAFAQLKLKILFKIMIKTYALEIIFGLLTIIVCFSLILNFVEPNINTFPDALWYCFAVVTTIGFGDLVAVTVIGRVLTVILGLYGLIVVAVITSIIVNFYNETAGKKAKDNLKEDIKTIKEDKDKNADK